jgi:hypothetical protein
MLVTLMALGFAAIPLTTVSAQKVALHATQEEINIWNQRRLNGPYKDDWDRIIANANSFVSSPSGTWPGNTYNSAWLGRSVQLCNQLPNVYPGGSSSGCRGSRTHGAKVRDAGFAYMVTGDTKYSTAVRSLLLTQAAIAGTNWANTTKWPTTYVSITNNGWAHDDHFITIWLRELLYAYSYTKATFSAGEKATMKTWFENAATWFAKNQHDEVDGQFPNRLSGSWTQSGNKGSSEGFTHSGGYEVFDFYHPWSNKRYGMTAFVTAFGVEFNNATLIHYAKTHLKEWLMFNVYPNGTTAEQKRWNDDGNPQTGFAYATTVIGSYITSVDHLARAGDTEIYHYSTSAGRFGSEGGPKSLLKVLQRYADQALGNTRAYISGGTQEWRSIDPDGESGAPVIRHWVTDLAVCQANVFFKDAKLRQNCQRSTPANPNHGGYNPWGGDWGNLPGVRFMFGQMDGKVWPYSSSQQLLSSPTPPSNAIAQPVAQ